MSCQLDLWFPACLSSYGAECQSLTIVVFFQVAFFSFCSRGNVHARSPMIPRNKNGSLLRCRKHKKNLFHPRTPLDHNQEPEQHERDSLQPDPSISSQEWVSTSDTLPSLCRSKRTPHYLCLLKDVQSVKKKSLSGSSFSQYSLRPSKLRVSSLIYYLLSFVKVMSTVPLPFPQGMLLIGSSSSSSTNLAIWTERYHTTFSPK